MSLQAAEDAIRHHERHDGRGKIAALTGIRGVAACWVVALHLFETAQRVGSIAAPPLASAPIVRSGYLGVDLFFILSGFVLTLSYWDGLSTASFDAIGRFAVGRICRVLPLHWFVLLVLGLAVSLAPHTIGAPAPSACRPSSPARFWFRRGSACPSLGISRPGP